MLIYTVWTLICFSCNSCYRMSERLCFFTASHTKMTSDNKVYFYKIKIYSNVFKLLNLNHNRESEFCGSVEKIYCHNITASNNFSHFQPKLRQNAAYAHAVLLFSDL